MTKNPLSVRELQKMDIDLIIQYWLNSEDPFLKGMGVDIARIPDKGKWEEMLLEQLSQPIEEKKSYCIIWQVDNKAVGHSNVNKIIFGEEAYMHLHIWDSSNRKKGFGIEFMKMTLPYFFKSLRLKKLYCEPFALNPAPNKALEKVGFEFVKEYTTIPGWLNFEQPVKLWELSYERFKQLI
jgi:RimJ/RimL family protein N-acetyltransferase